MTIFAIIAQPDTKADRLGNAIGNAYPNDIYKLEANAWLVSASATAQEVCNKVGISDGANGAAVVVEVASYYGRANPAIWTWIKSKWENGPHG